VSGDGPIGRVVRFGVFEVDLAQRELRRSGLRIRLQEQPFQLLAALLERPGEIVTREELRSKLWPGDTFVDFEHSLNAAVKRLRDALGESAETPIFVETIPRRGYRFIGQIATLPGLSSIHPRRRKRFFTTGIGVLSGLAGGALVMLSLYYGRSFRSHESRPTVIPIVTSVGEKITPSLSPDGQHLAYAWNGGTGPHFSIYVKLVGTEESLRLTKQPSIDFNPVWSPDGRYIAFARIVKGGTAIYVIPALGGTERRLRETHWLENEFYQVFWFFGRLSWSPDGKILAYSDRASVYRPASSIFLLILDSMESRKLTSPQGSVGDYNPAFSPDGQTLAFNRGAQGITSIYTVPVSGGSERHLISGVQYGWGLAWTSEGRDIVFAKAGWDAGWLWKIPRDGGEPTRLQFGQEGVQPSIRGNRLVYARQTANVTIWRRVLNSMVSAGPSHKFIHSTRMESGPQFSPNGGQIAFESTRSGAYEVWMCRSDGTGLVQLTHFNSSAGTPRWSPDGQQIAFDSRALGNADIFVLDSQGGPPHRLTSERSSDVVPSWSRDGRWIYFASDRTGDWQVWKMPSTGGPAVQVTHHGGFSSFESLDGRFLYYAKGQTLPGLWRIPTNGGEEIRLTDSLEVGYWGYWAVGEKGIYYLDTTERPGIAFFNITSRRTTRMFDLENRPALEAPGLAVSPDKKTILYTQLDALNSDIILVENFQ
jgi:Tol biopolymer transport system component/DNA-binding winged helix-turn-helix (wHTH) protein